MEEIFILLIEKGIKICFFLTKIVWKFIKKKEVVLNFCESKNEKWRENYEKNNFNPNKLFEKILTEFDKEKKIYINGYLPIPFYVILGAYNSKDNFEKFKKIRTKNSFGKFGNKVKLTKKRRISKIPTLLILESKNVKNEKYDFLIKSKKNKFLRNSISKHSLKKQLKNFMIEINKLQKRGRIEAINVSIVGSPSVSFLVGKILFKYNFIFNILHYSLLDKKNIIKGKLGPDKKIKLF